MSADRVRDLDVTPARLPSCLEPLDDILSDDGMPDLKPLRLTRSVAVFERHKDHDTWTLELLKPRFNIFDVCFLNISIYIFLNLYNS